VEYITNVTAAAAAAAAANVFQLSLQAIPVASLKNAGVSLMTLLKSHHIVGFVRSF
jgi:hypothetical protein